MQITFSLVGKGIVTNLRKLMSHRPVDCQLFLDISLLLECLQAHKAQLMVHYASWWVERSYRTW